eukprot:scaffold152_cov383-Prasinococcus_capsulatus_cf.AAC.8
MSGRGVSFTVRLEGLHDIPVDAALHTALGIFKQMLEQQLRRRGHHFPSEQQVRCGRALAVLLAKRERTR